MFWLFVAFILMYALMSKIALPKVGAALETREAQKTQNLSRASSCAYQGGTEDRYILLLREGERVSLSLETGAFAPFLILRDDRTVTGPAVAVQRLTAPGRAAVSYTATFTGFHEIIVTSNDFTSQGQYTLAVTSP